MALGMERAALQPPVLALPHNPLHVSLGYIQILEHRPLVFTAAISAFRHPAHARQRQRQIAAQDLPAETFRSREVTVRQPLYLPQA